MSSSQLVEFSELFDHWMGQLETHDHYKELTSADILRIQQNSKEFLSTFVKSTPRLSKTDAKAIKPFLEFLRNIRKTHEQQGLTIRDTTLLTLSLKSSLNEYLKDVAGGVNPILEELNYLLDVFGILSFELYSNEQEKLIGKKTNQIEFLQRAEHKAFGQLIGSSSAMKVIYQAIGLVLENDVTVLLQGETGTGKDLIASVIHNYSTRKQFPFVAINCGAIPDNLIESELFGHEKGAFTGAEDQRIGKFELADQGTLFLDEISELRLDQQTRLLRVLQNQEVQRIGGNNHIPVNVRIIAASNKPLEALVNANEFRLDLFYRLNVFPIHVPKLVDRENDVLLLADFFLEKYSAQMKVSKPKLHSSAIKSLLSQQWPGNIRELENLMQRALIITDGKEITDSILGYKPGISLPPPLLTSGKDPDNFIPKSFVPMTLSEHEEQLIKDTLVYCKGNIKKAAEILGVSRTTLYNKFDKYNISSI